MIRNSQKVYILHDSHSNYSHIADVVSRYHDVQKVELSAARTTDFLGAFMIIVDIKLTGYTIVNAIKKALNNPTLIDVPSLFILSAMARREIVQAKALGAAEFLYHPLDDQELIKMLSRVANDRIENSWSDLSKTQQSALKVCLKVFEDTFDHVRDGKPFSQSEVREGCDLVIQAVAEDGIVEMMDAVREHHNLTYRHSMMVCGYLVSFGLLIGVRGAELQQLSVCGLVHDIGKAFIPLKVLDKPGPLDEDDWVIMHSHPKYTRQILQDTDCDPTVIDGAIHHHEKLDGSGYPDGLKSDEVSDIARLVAIADVFSGLTEKRSYKPSLLPSEAYDIMMTMKGHLDLDLLRAFKPVVLDMQSENYARKTSEFSLVTA